MHALHHSCSFFTIFLKVRLILPDEVRLRLGTACIQWSCVVPCGGRLTV